MVAWGRGGFRAPCDRTLSVCSGANEHTTQLYSTETSILKHPLTAAYITADLPGGGPWDRQQISEQLGLVSLSAVALGFSSLVPLQGRYSHLKLPTCTQSRQCQHEYLQPSFKVVVRLCKHRPRCRGCMVARECGVLTVRPLLCSSLDQAFL